MRTATVAVVAWVLAVALAVAWVATRSVAITEMASVPMVPAERQVSRAADADKPGTARSVMGQLRFTQTALTSAPSPDRLDFTFDAPATITGVLVSVDERGMEMTEIAVGINAEMYGVGGARDWLVHTSDTAGGAGTDETVMFPEGFRVEAGDRVSVVAWLYNTRSDPYWVSPEVIVFYRWD